MTSAVVLAGFNPTIELPKTSAANAADLLRARRGRVVMSFCFDDCMSSFHLLSRTSAHLRYLAGIGELKCVGYPCG